MASMKIQKLEKQVEREIAKILQEDVKEDLGFITITGVSLTNDLSFAKVYFSVLGNEDKRDSVKRKLEKAKGFVKTTLGSRVQMRKIPELIFAYDESIDYGNKIEKLLQQVKEKDNQ
jgi:ribosome-binding factor A